MRITLRTRGTWWLTRFMYDQSINCMFHRDRNISLLEFWFESVIGSGTVGMESLEGHSFAERWPSAGMSACSASSLATDCTRSANYLPHLLPSDVTLKDLTSRKSIKFLSTLAILIVTWIGHYEHTLLIKKRLYDSDTTETLKVTLTNK